MTNGRFYPKFVYLYSSMKIDIKVQCFIQFTRVIVFALRYLFNNLRNTPAINTMTCQTIKLISLYKSKYYIEKMIGTNADTGPYGNKYILPPTWLQWAFFSFIRIQMHHDLKLDNYIRNFNVSMQCTYCTCICSKLH